jgi:pyruvate dehydrogenase E2 component (dihydrolipoamide acetyltransferase)
VSGRLVEILLHADQEAKVGDRVAWVETNESEPARSAAPASSVSASRTPPPPTAQLQTQSNERILSTPVARRLAGEHGVDLARVAGSGPRGRVQLEDVQRAIGRNTASESRPVPASPLPGMSAMRRAVARAMTLSNATVPQFWVERTLDMSTLQSVRAELSTTAVGSPKLSVNDFLLQACARGLLEFPALNATFSGNPDSSEARIVPACWFPCFTTWGDAASRSSRAAGQISCSARSRDG